MKLAGGGGEMQSEKGWRRPGRMKVARLDTDQNGRHFTACVRMQQKNKREREAVGAPQATQQHSCESTPTRSPNPPRKKPAKSWPVHLLRTCRRLPHEKTTTAAGTVGPPAGRRFGDRLIKSRLNTASAASESTYANSQRLPLIHVMFALFVGGLRSR